MPHEHARTDEALARRKFYDSIEWLDMRAWVLSREPMCRRCKAAGRIVAASVVDHIKPWREGDGLALDPENLQALCPPCHDGGKQWEDRHGIARGCDADGNPRDTTSHWHREAPEGRRGG